MFGKPDVILKCSDVMAWVCPRASVFSNYFRFPNLHTRFNDRTLMNVCSTVWKIMCVCFERTDSKRIASSACPMCVDVSCVCFPPTHALLCPLWHTCLFYSFLKSACALATHWEIGFWHLNAPAICCVLSSVMTQYSVLRKIGEEVILWWRRHSFPRTMPSG